jgi:glucose-1-phosphate cytidylyltransferase
LEVRLIKVIILAGGFGTRLSEHTDSIPKPMVSIGNKPILWHIMRTFAHFSHKDFYIALGYKASVVKEYFLNYRELNSDFTVDLSDGSVKTHQQDKIDWNVTLVDTGIKSMTGGRIKRIQDFIGNETFLLTYGDGVADINIEALINFHKKHGKMVTVSAVRPGARFGELSLNEDVVSSFEEKPQTTQGWVNGGYFVCEPAVFDFIDNDDTVFEKQPLEEISRLGELIAFKHYGYWQCMDTKRDLDTLVELWDSEKAPWKV